VSKRIGVIAAGRPSGRFVVLDGQGVESYDDLEDVTYLELDYVMVIGDVVAATIRPGALDALFIGGGGFMLSRYFPAIRPGSTATVIEIDAVLIDLSTSMLGLDTGGPGLRVLTGDARLLVAREPVAAFDLLVVRAEVATMAQVFDHVALIAERSELAGISGGNFILGGSRVPIDHDATQSSIGQRDGSEQVRVDGALVEF
jgi:hypothetical protein